MIAKDLMNDYPPTPDKQVTLANWRQSPFNSWSYRNVRRLLPTANIAATQPGKPFETSLESIEDIEFVGIGDQPTTLAKALRATHTDALVMLRRGRIAAEWYANGMDARTPHIVFSVSKSICGSLGGILTDRNLLDPDDLITDYVPELERSVYGNATVRHLLDMTVGIKFVEDYDDPDGDVIRYRYAMGWDIPPPSREVTDVRRFLATMRPDGKPHGDTFHYVSTNTDVLGWVYERACEQPLSDILSEYLWSPLGAEHDGYVTVDSHNAMRAAGGICVTPRDLARFGEMMRRRGVAADGRQVVPGWWIDDINEHDTSAAWARGDFAELFPGASYRSKWYQIDRTEGVLCALGIHGQWIYIRPEAELVIVRLASEAIPLDPDHALSWRRGFDAIADAFL
ncbi:MAG: serine hydrolase domain-containing protein [Xanthobacteraceae bacterium]